MAFWDSACCFGVDCGDFEVVVIPHLQGNMGN